jgi:hypothetical protein
MQPNEVTKFFFVRQLHTKSRVLSAGYVKINLVLTLVLLTIFKEFFLHAVRVQVTPNG